MAEYAFEGAVRPSTAITWSFGGQTYVSDQRYPFTQPIGLPYQDTIRAAFNRWAAVSALTFTEVTDSPAAQIRVGFGRFPSRLTIGETDYASAAGVLRPDTIVRLLDPGQIALVPDPISGWDYAGVGVTLYQDALHEIGHSLGLDHSSDPVTTMYPVLTPRNADLAAGDILGINTLYPLYVVAALDPVQIEGTATYHFTITRLGDPAAALALNYSVSGTAYPGLVGTAAATSAAFPGGAFPTGVVTFAAGAASTTLTVGTVGTTLPRPDQGFAITLASRTGQPITTRGQTGAVILDDNGQASISGTTTSVYRFFDTGNGTHFFTASEKERNGLIMQDGRFAYEGPALAAVAAPLAASGADPAATAVYRFFDQRFGTHFYTADLGERDAVLAGRPDLVFEGTGFYEHRVAGAGDVAVYRFFDIGLGTHFYTSTGGERATIAATRPDLLAEGIAFYAPSST